MLFSTLVLASAINFALPAPPAQAGALGGGIIGGKKGARAGAVVGGIAGAIRRK